MQIELDLTKSVEQNAERYFEKSKKAKGKIEGITEAIEMARKKLVELNKKAAEEEKRAAAEKEKAEQRKVAKSKQEWFEKFRWFISSEGFLVIGGRDATTNEIVIKKHTDNDDIVFHTEMAGSPFFVIKQSSQPGKKPGQQTLEETAVATLAFSRAWKLGIPSAEVFWVTPEQVSKTALTGEFIPKGAFMIRGKKNILRPKADIAVGITKDGRVMGGPLFAVKSNCEKYVEIAQGTEKSSDAAKKIKAKIGGEVDDIIRVMPAGGCKVKKIK